MLEEKTLYLGGCQNHGLFLGPLDTRCCIILRTEKGTIILATTHLHAELLPLLLSGQALGGV